MRFLILLFAFALNFNLAIAQVGTIKTEQYQAEFEKKQAIDALPEYTDTIQIPIQLLKIGINEEFMQCILS